MNNEKMVAALTSELRTGFGTIKDALAETNQRLDKTNERIEKTNERLDKLSVETNERLDRLTERVDRGFNGLGIYLMELEKHHDARLQRLKKRDLER